MYVIIYCSQLCYLLQSNTAFFEILTVFSGGRSRNFLQGGHQPGKPGKVREFDSSQGKVGESGKSQGKCVLPVVCYRGCDGHRISIA